MFSNRAASNSPAIADALTGSSGTSSPGTGIRDSNAPASRSCRPSWVRWAYTVARSASRLSVSTPVNRRSSAACAFGAARINASGSQVAALSFLSSHACGCCGDIPSAVVIFRDAVPASVMPRSITIPSSSSQRITAFFSPVLTGMSGNALPPRSRASIASSTEDLPCALRPPMMMLSPFALISTIEILLKLVTSSFTIFAIARPPSKGL